MDRMPGLVRPLIEKKLIEFLEEDTHGWDLSSKVVPKKNVTAILTAKSNGILAGIEIFKLLFTLLDVKVQIDKTDGCSVESGDRIITLTGAADKILVGERVGLNLLSRMSGIATLTHSFVTAIKRVQSKTKLAGTRKTLPGLRLFDKLAIEIGEGDSHRFTLQDCIMLKDNHLKLFDSVSHAVKVAKQNTTFAHKIEVECKTIEEAKSAIRAGADIIMLDNFSVEEAKEAIKKLRSINAGKNILIELSGNITLENVNKYAQIGADVISTGAITHSIKALDFSLNFT